VIQRDIKGPQERFERSGAQRLRDIRPLTTRLWSGLMSDASALLLAGGAGAMFVEPALVDLIAPRRAHTITPRLAPNFSLS